MTPDKAVKVLVGKTIKDVTHYSYHGRPMYVSEILFTDGTILELGGNADWGCFDFIDGERIE